MQLTASAKGKLCLEHSARNSKKAECYFATMLLGSIWLHRTKGMMGNTVLTVVEDRTEAGEKF